MWTLPEDQILMMIQLFTSLGVLGHGAPKGSYDVELILANFKNLSVFRRHYLPLQEKLPDWPQVNKTTCELQLLSRQHRVVTLHPFQK